MIFSNIARETRDRGHPNQPLTKCLILLFPYNGLKFNHCHLVICLIFPVCSTSIYLKYPFCNKII